MKTPAWLTRERLQRMAPLAVAVAILLVAWMMLIQPRRASARRAASEIAILEPRVGQLSPASGAQTGAVEEGSLTPDVIGRLPAVDPVPDVLERLARLALLESSDPATADGAVSQLTIETGEQAVTGSGEAAGPRATGPAERDPRVMLFGLPLAYTQVTVSFESSYARLGRFLWDLRELPTMVEVHSLDVRPVSADGARVRTTMILFVYRRTGQGTDVRVVARAGVPA